MKIRPIGGYGAVGGSCTIINHDKRYYLIDCGCSNASPDVDHAQQTKLPFKPIRLHAVFITHAHYDHFGLLPYVIQQGFRGLVYCTKPTAELIRAVLLDASRQPGSGFTSKDVDQINFRILEDLEDFKFGKYYALDSNLTFAAIRTSHILGSVSFEFQYGIGKGLRDTVVFSGDIGNNTDGNEYQTLLKGRQHPTPHAKHIICESTYGGRTRDPKFASFENRIEALRRLILLPTNDGGSRLILIPSFALHRMQELLTDLHIAVEQLETTSDHPEINIYVDSPLGRRIGEIYTECLFLKRSDGNSLYLNPQLQKRLHCADEDKLYELLQALFGLFGEIVQFKKYTLHFGPAPNQSKPGVTIVLAASGMCDGGKISNYLSRNFKNPNCHIILTGFQAPGSTGEKLKQMCESPSPQLKDTLLGMNEAKLDFHIHDLAGYYSGHADEDGLIEYLLCKDSQHSFNTLDTIILNHGEHTAREELRRRIILETKGANSNRRQVKMVTMPFTHHGWFDCKTGNWLHEHHKEVECVEAGVLCCLERLKRIERTLLKSPDRPTSDHSLRVLAGDIAQLKTILTQLSGLT